MVGIEGRDEPYRIDLVARCRDEHGWVVGFEIKRGFFFMKEYAAAIKQTADYRSSTISDPIKAPRLEGRRLPAIFVFPNWNGLHDNGEYEYAKEAVGMQVLAGKFRVGVCGLSKTHGLTLMIGLNRLWSQGGGWIWNAEKILFGKRQLGSQRQKEASKWGMGAI